MLCLKCNTCKLYHLFVETGLELPEFENADTAVASAQI